jgi:hypothetical protein
MATPDKPYEWGHPQFDPETHRQWSEFADREGNYVNGPGLTFKPPKERAEPA